MQSLLPVIGPCCHAGLKNYESIVLTVMHCADALCRGEGETMLLHDASKPMNRALKDADRA